MERGENTHFKFLYGTQVNNKGAVHAGSKVQMCIGERETMEGMERGGRLGVSARWREDKVRMRGARRGAGMAQGVAQVNNSVAPIIHLLPERGLNNSSAEHADAYGNVRSIFSKRKSMKM